MNLKIEIDMDTLIRRFGEPEATVEVAVILSMITDRVYLYGAEGKRPLIDSCGEVAGFAWVEEEEVPS